MANLTPNPSPKDLRLKAQGGEGRSNAGSSSPHTGGERSVFVRQNAPQGLPSAEADHRHEMRDVNLKLVGLAAGILVTMAICIELGLGWALALFRRTPERVNAQLPPIRGSQAPPAPRLWRFAEPNRQTPEQNYQALNREEERMLSTYAWIDRSRGVVHVPIERAKELLLSGPTPGPPAPESGTAQRAFRLPSH